MANNNKNKNRNKNNATTLGNVAQDAVDNKDQTPPTTDEPKTDAPVQDAPKADAPEAPKAPEETKPAEPKADEKPPADPQPKSDPVTPSEVVKIKAMLGEYKELASKRVISSTLRDQIVSRFVAIMNFATSNGTTEVLDELFNFFVTEKNGLMAEKTALRGISKLGKTTMMKVEVLYTVLRVTVANRTAKKKTKIDIGVVREKLGEGFVAYLATKNR